MSDHTIIIVDDHPLVRDALCNTMMATDGIGTVLEANGFKDLIAQLKAGKDIDLVLYDLHMPGIQGIFGLLYLRRLHPELPVIVVSAQEDHQTIMNCINAGASGYVLKSMSVNEIQTCIGTVLAGQVWFPQHIDWDLAKPSDTSKLVARFATLTQRQLEVTMAIGDGLLNKQIAYELGLQEATVKAHMSQVLQKLDLVTRTDVVIALNKLNIAGQSKIL